MTTVMLEPDLAKQIEDYLAHSQTSIELADVVERALRRYLREMGRQKIRRELQAFEQQKPNLLQPYFGKYVAIHEGQVIDHDSDLRQLNQRVFQQLGRTPVLQKKVTDTPERDIVIRSPRLDRV